MNNESKIIKIADYLPKVMADLAENNMGLRSGLSKLDKSLQGFKPSELIILAGRPSQGKTSLMTDMALNISKDKSALIFSCETCAKILIERMLANLAKVSYLRLKSNMVKENEQQRIEAAKNELIKRQIFIDESSLLTPLEIERRLTELTKEYKIDCVFIDYLQLMALHKASSNRNQELSVICRHLKAIAKKFNLPVVVLSQLNRALEYRESKRPQLSDLRDSGSIEQDADIVLLLYRPGYYKKINNPNAIDDGYAELIIAKQRNGPVGVVSCMWDGIVMSFSEGIELGDF